MKNKKVEFKDDPEKAIAQSMDKLGWPMRIFIAIILMAFAMAI